MPYQDGKWWMLLEVFLSTLLETDHTATKICVHLWCVEVTCEPVPPVSNCLNVIFTLHIKYVLKTSCGHTIYVYALSVSPPLLLLFTSFYNNFSSLCASHPFLFLNAKLFFHLQDQGLVGWFSHHVTNFFFEQIFGTKGPRCYLDSFQDAYNGYIYTHGS